MTRKMIVCAGVSILTMTMCATLARAQDTSSGNSGSPAMAGVAEKKPEHGGNGPSLKGRGTPGQLAAWLDDRTLGDSVIAEIDGLIGIGTTTPESKVTVADDASFNAVLRVNNLGASGTAVLAEGSDRTTDQGGEAIVASGGDSPVVAGDGILTSGGSGMTNRGGNGVRTIGGDGVIAGGAAISATGGRAAGPGHRSGDGISAAPGQAFNGAAPGRAGMFHGDVDVTGTLTKGGGSFRIDHPLDPANRYLSHSFVESPDMMNVYNGNITTDAQGLAIVELPTWFNALNKDFRYQLTVIGTFAQAMIAEKIAGNRFAIRTSAANVEVSWQITGIRRDAWAEQHRIPVDEEKPAAERGRYLHPGLYGQPVEKSIEWLRHPELMQPRSNPGIPTASGKTESPE